MSGVRQPRSQWDFHSSAAIYLDFRLLSYPPSRSHPDQEYGIFELMYICFMFIPAFVFFQYLTLHTQTQLLF